MAIIIDTSKCIGCGRCTEICPNTFKLNEMGKAEIINQNDINCSKTASDECPMEAIHVSL